MQNRFPKGLTKGTGFIALFIFMRPALAADFASTSPPEFVSRFEKLESKILELQNQLVEQNKRHEEEIQEIKRTLEVKGPQEKSVYLAPSPAAAPKWLEGLGMAGDLRLRYEAFNQNEATRDRNRFRYRLRWKITKQLTEDLELGFRFISGSNTDPSSPMQTFTGDFTYKNIFIDQAYVKYRPSFLIENIPHLQKAEIGGGKVENPFLETSSGMVWDQDVMPEGFYESMQFGFFDKKLNPFVNLGQFILQESAAASDAELYGVQTGIRWTPPGFSKDSDVKLTHALAYYDFSDYTRDSNFVANGASLAGGNTAAGTSLAAADFNVLQIYNDLKFKIANLPVKIFGDFAVNLGDQTPDPLNRNHAYTYGLRLGEAKKKKDWELTYYYAFIEPNAVVGAFNDSDFGAGHANKRGSVFQLKYKLTESMRLGLSGYFANNVTGADDETRRFQTDVEWLF